MHHKNVFLVHAEPNTAAAHVNSEFSGNRERAYQLRIVLACGVAPLIYKRAKLTTYCNCCWHRKYKITEHGCYNTAPGCT